MFSFSGTSTTGVEESATSIAGLGTVGWRARWDFGLNVGIAGGFQYIADPAISFTTVKSTGFQPLLLLDIGVSF